MSIYRYQQEKCIIIICTCVIVSVYARVKHHELIESRIQTSFSSTDVLLYDVGARGGNSKKYLNIVRARNRSIISQTRQDHFRPSSMASDVVSLRRC